LKIEPDFQAIAEQFANRVGTPTDIVCESSPSATLSAAEMPEDQLMESMFEFEETIEQALVTAH
jgi:hypothetical protein